MSFSLSSISQLSAGAAGAAKRFIYENAPSFTASSPQAKMDTTLDDFGDILALNDKVLQETSDDLSEEDVKKYDLDPPRVVVVGLTSAGKSSLLERVVGFPIFPVLDRVCTRQPFQLSMKRVRKGAASDAKNGDIAEAASKKAAASPTQQQQGAVASEEKKENSGSTAAHAGEHEGILRFPASGKSFRLPEQVGEVRGEIASLQRSNSERVEFSTNEIRATVHSAANETFTFTDLPGVFLVSEMKMGKSFAKSREENARLQKETMNIAKHYVQRPNTIVLVVISSTDWTHGMNNDPLCGHLAEWLEETRRSHNVDVYGVITKLDMQSTLSKNSPIRKVLTGSLPDDHILQGLKVKKWIPVVSSPSILKQTDLKQAEVMELEAIQKCLKTCIPSSALNTMPLGRRALLRELKFALLKAIIKTQRGLQERVGKFADDVEARLRTLPRPATISEKRQIFDLRLKVMEEHLKSLVGATGATASNSLRMQLMVEAPTLYEKSLLACSLRGNIRQDVQQILNQAALEAGGSFDSDVSFNTLSRRIINCYRKPSLELVSRCANIILKALKLSVDKAFGDYKQLRVLVMRTLGLHAESADVKADVKFEGNTAPSTMFGTLKRSVVSKVLSLIDAHGTMICFHPMWRNFDTLHTKILKAQSRNSGGGLFSTDSKSPDQTLQHMLELPALAKRVSLEGRNAIKTYEDATGQTISMSNRDKICKHFARVEVMGYIIRMSLMGCVFPIIIRDLRDGLFEGIKCGLTTWDFSVSRLLRTKLLFDPKMEKTVLMYMDPSSEDAEKRRKWEKKKAVLNGLQLEFDKCQDRLQILQDVFNKP
mmetsp:Transcript_28006/g.49405  ORF Transcript_28006/g.49405 Transcript_28006/m.49405 type:complete len:826 (+) Transcript_28006:172-2649(+)|eukprot:CAMPEP_0197530020 /NCGR_PEP_ID=MMETSP1318-20131121/30402_1 /TAXON_ID=552666 /ORGANISM="Partenskyella glossopodia, Strain RCC365" /LENGTH=825 /DNA_ID=CAMNT_0043085683 /DNA_START=124 /DNA_END=2601 /DNA_ORIENTATION=+